MDDNKIKLPEGSISLYFPFPPRSGRGENGNEWFLWKCKPAGQEGNAENALFPTAVLHTSLLSVAGPIVQGSNGREQWQNGGFDATITRTGTGNASRYEVTAGRMESAPAPQAHSNGQPQQQPQANGEVPNDGIPSPWQLVSTYGFCLKEARQLWWRRRHRPRRRKRNSCRCLHSNLIMWAMTCPSDYADMARVGAGGRSPRVGRGAGA